MTVIFWDLIGAGIFLFLAFAGWSLVIRAHGQSLDKAAFPPDEGNSDWLFNELDDDAKRPDPKEFVTSSPAPVKKIKVVERNGKSKKTAQPKDENGRFISKKKVANGSANSKGNR